MPRMSRGMAIMPRIFGINGNIFILVNAIVVPAMPLNIPIPMTGTPAMILSIPAVVGFQVLLLM
jgi:hypothetical protein